MGERQALLTQDQEIDLLKTGRVILVFDVTGSRQQIMSSGLP